jgi:CHAT domain-containing protein/Tfp pilus assembly protein PilF
MRRWSLDIGHWTLDIGHWSRLVSLWLCAFVLFAHTPTLPDSHTPTLIVESVAPDSPAAKAGIKVGDRLLTYDGKPLTSPAALIAARENTFGKAETKFRTEVALRLQRGSETLTLTVPIGRLGMGARPDLPPAALTLYQEGANALRSTAALQARKVDEVIARWTAAATATQEAGDQAAAAWLHALIGDVHGRQRQWKEAREAYTAAWALLKAGKDAAAQSLTLGALGEFSMNLNDYPTAQQWFEQAQQVAAAAGLEWWAADFLNSLGMLAAVIRSDAEAAQNYFSRALTIRERLMPNSLEVADTLHNLGLMAKKKNNLEAAHDYFSRALAIRERLAPDSLDVVKHLINLSSIASTRGDLKAADDYYTRASAAAQRLPSGSLSVADVLYQLGIIARDRGDLKGAHDDFARALAIQERLTPDSLEVARTLNYLGMVVSDQGDLKAGHDYYTRSLAIAERLAPDGLDVANCLHNLGELAWERGDLVTAHDDFTRALAIYNRRAPNSTLAANTILMLGLVAEVRGDLETAHDYFAQALKRHTQISPDSIEVATALVNLGNVAHARGDLTAAHDNYSRALTILQRRVPDSTLVPNALTGLGFVAKARDDLTAAHDDHRRALEMRERQSPNSLRVAASLNNLGIVAGARGDLKTARDYYTRALKILQQLAPDSLDVAINLSNLGEVAFAERRFAEALDNYSRAIVLIEAQRRHIVSPEARALLVEQHTDRYAGLLRTYLALNDQSAAFSTLERARARSLVEMLSERRVDFAADAPKELLQKQQELDDQRNIAYKQLSKLDPEKDTARMEQLRADIAKIAIGQRQLVAEIRQKSPQYAALQYPQPLDLKGAQAALDAGTLLLMYLVGDDETYLFAVTKTNLQLHRLKVKRGELRERVEKFRLALANQAAFRPRGRALYDLLVRPAQAQVDKAQRVLICPDGSLHTLPFAALIQGKDGGRYFVEAKPLHTIVSMTVYAEIRKQQPSNHPTTQPSTLLAMGDPQYDALPEKVKQDSLKRGMKLTPLPHTRLEVEAIQKLYGKQAVVRLGRDANESMAKSESAQATMVHFACHGVLDNRNPLASALALSAEGEAAHPGAPTEDGMLRAFEVLEKMKLNADLVVLSACETGLGEESKNEGIVGLTRAFQYAGAKSVVVSLWQIADESTAALMTAFYSELKKGTSKDVALQRAMATVRKNPKWAHPFFWAAFTQAGDWK